MSKSHITTHILDTAAGKPAADVAVRLYVRNGQAWDLVGEGVTDSDGRVSSLGPQQVPTGTYQLQFDTGEYFARIGSQTFFPEVSLTFSVQQEQDHYHVPLLLSPFAYSTYRGS